jgi:hypothetical protein
MEPELKDPIGPQGAGQGHENMTYHRFDSMVPSKNQAVKRLIKENQVVPIEVRRGGCSKGKPQLSPVDISEGRNRFPPLRFKEEQITTEKIL